ncbi:MAG TPA: cytochrome c biogenesis protein CcsA [Blastocatellia bacterium]|nr:cytochrome c biogenesis protein CcsA [Blastocatellia bacterium]
MDILWTIVLVGYALCAAQALITLKTRRTAMHKPALVALAVAFGAHTAWLLAQGVRAGRCPMVGTKEMCAFLAWGIIASYLIVSRWHKANALRAFIFPIVLVLAIVSAAAPYTPEHPEGIANPLQGWLFPIHAGLILLAYSAFFIAFGAGLMYILQEYELKHKKFGTLFYRLPSLEVCDAISVKAMVVGFALLTLGLAAGVGWSRARDGVYWHGEPIEIFAAFTWLVYLILIQSRVSSRWGGRTAAIASIVSFMIVVCSLVGVRYLGTLHVFG